MSLFRTSSRRMRAGLSLAGIFLAVGFLVPSAANALIPIGDGGGGGVITRPPTTRATTRPPVTVPTVTIPSVTFQPSTPPPAPRYKVEAVSFKANDESGIDWLGSDEPLWVFNGTGGDGAVKTVTREFDDVDTGDTFSFGSLCVVTDCVNGVTGPMALQVTLIETDLFGSDGDSYGKTAKQIIDAVCPYTGSYKPICMGAGPVVQQIASWLGDDLIKTTTISWPETDLAPMYPGQAVQESVNLSDGDASYTFTFRTTRLS